MTSTPAVVKAAGVTRGALYHHFEDKAALFAAVLEREAEAVAAAVRRVDLTSTDPLERLMAGAAAYLGAMASDGRADLMLVQGPAVLGRAKMRAIEGRHGDATLADGLAEAAAAGALPAVPGDHLASLLGAMFERAALDVASGMPADDLLLTVTAILTGLTRTA